MTRSARAAALLAALALAAPNARARQQPDGAPPHDTITGRVLAEGGRAVAGADVRVWSRAGGTSHVVASDDEGRFVVTDVAPGAYSVDAEAPAYVSETERGDAPIVRPGEDVTVRLVRGAVITGKVTDAEGAPVVAVPVRAIRTRDGRGRPLADREWVNVDMTDDRGVYRIYELRPGTYLVAAGESGSEMWGLASSYDADAPTYYPSSGPSTASPVAVGAGQEVGGIDISYRGEPGHTVAGRVAGGVIRRNSYCRVVLVRPGTSETLLEWDHNVSASPLEFEISGVADGEYEMKALWYASDDEAYYSVPKRVVVRGADVTGVLLEVVPFGSVAGTVVVEKAADAEACARKEKRSVAETVVSARLAAVPPRVASEPFAVAGDDGAFKVKFLRPGTYHLRVRLSDRRWYVKSVARASARPTPRGRSDAARDGIRVAEAEAARDVIVTVADGAASATGRVAPPAEGAKLPDSLRVYLVPADRADAEDGARYFETWAGDDGAFSFVNLAPGRYFALVRREPTGEDGVTPYPAFWDPAKRAALLREAADHGRELTLGRCEDLADINIEWPAAPK
jgi:protocatechuate 3,4-dioxygenase beta subunit